MGSTRAPAEVLGPAKYQLVSFLLRSSCSLSVEPPVQYTIATIRNQDRSLLGFPWRLAPA
ncbi:hypothetical protein [Sporisorium scitamineum]|uniref:Uncharacterized protein n=1 Tax=Sporisorium scitamineum TaxID=49012 RepID=A0A0F7S2V3_9BASI|nr:hypothetical protein [Sporisorium scitamineum]